MVQVVLAAVLLSSSLNITSVPGAETPFGRVDGRVKELTGGETKCEEFLGIPYAEPPLRFQAPVPWNATFIGGVYNASRLGSPCVQRRGWPDLDVVGSEDCLYLNVWRPAGASPEAQLPVMLWIHGGAFKMGASKAPNLEGTDVYDGCRLAAQQDVIVVSLNYRLGIHGFAAFRQKSNPELFDANLALQDQREAMRWVQGHIGGFGGDAKSVTIFGESAGGMCAFYHMLSPLSEGLFRAVISQSGDPYSFIGHAQASLTERVGQLLNCTGPALRTCMQSADVVTLTTMADDITANLMAPGWGITVDGIQLLEPLEKIMQKGEYTAVPLLLGYDKDEANMFAFTTFHDPIGKEEQLDYMVHTNPPTMNSPSLRAEFRLKSEGLLDVYNQRYNDSDGRYALAAIYSDALFICGAVASSRWHSSRASTYLFRFSATPSCPSAGIPGAFHGIELPYVFGNSPYGMNSEGCAFDADEKALVDAVQTRWANFAKTLSPDGVDQTVSPIWPAFTNQSKLIMVFRDNDTGVEVLDDERVELCDSWPHVSSLFH